MSREGKGVDVSRERYVFCSPAIGPLRTGQAIYIYHSHHGIWTDGPAQRKEINIIGVSTQKYGYYSCKEYDTLLHNVTVFGYYS